MNKSIRFIGDCCFTGILVVVPVLLLALVLGEMFEAIHGLAGFVADSLPYDILPPIYERMLAAIFLIIACLFVVGLSARAGLLNKFFSNLEKQSLGRLQIYKLLKRLSYGVLGANNESAMKCCIYQEAKGRYQLAYLIEEGKYYSTIMLPFAPAAMSGPILMVEHANIQRVDIKMSEAMLVLNQMGEGMQALLDK
ncbi:hypothetical protein [Agaribacterium sp. ZY112]|uniref:hypothetical protein n=1 Tax=Agaribacterium sp. ZY112 TaxID=3233574 RepID=UPI00352595D2